MHKILKEFRRDHVTVLFLQWNSENDWIFLYQAIGNQVNAKITEKWKSEIVFLILIYRNMMITMLRHAGIYFVYLFRHLSPTPVRN